MKETQACSFAFSFLIGLPLAAFQTPSAQTLAPKPAAAQPPR
jgi:hypothetical protein